jgi:hypothetical protein
VAVVGGYAYVADCPDLRVISVADPAHPTEVGHYTSPYALGVAVTGSLAYLADISDGVRVVSVADPANPIEVGYYKGDYQVSGVAVDGDYIYAASADSGLQVYEFYGAGVEESPKPQASSRKPAATILSGASGVTRLAASVAFDAMGRRAVNPRSGIYFVRGRSAVSGKPSAVTKVVIQR